MTSVSPVPSNGRYENKIYFIISSHYFNKNQQNLKINKKSTNSQNQQKSTKSIEINKI